MAVRRNQSLATAGQGRESEELDAINARVRARRKPAQAIRQAMEGQIEQRAKGKREAEAAAASKAKPTHQVPKD